MVAVTESPCGRLEPAFGATPAGDSLADHSGKVRIYRDSKGVPHVFAETAPAVLFGLGYAFGQDRLVEMELRRRSALGTRAELLGKSALAGDEIARNRSLSPAELMRMFHALSAEHQAMMKAFVMGINRSIAEISRSPATLTPYEFVKWGIRPSPWKLIDYLALIASIPNSREGSQRQNAAFLDAMTARYGSVVGREIFEDVVPIDDPDSPTVIPQDEDLAPPEPMPLPGNAYKVDMPSVIPRKGASIGASPDVPGGIVAREASRCLVIGPKRSATGHVLMMEATADGPEAQLYGGGFDTAGFSFAGWGPPFMGRSLQHAWLMTSGVAETTDTYEEQLNPADRHQYWFQCRWRTMSHRFEKILVHGQAPVFVEVAHTAHGPVVGWDVTHNRAYTERYAIRGHELDDWAAGVELARARTLSEFESKGLARMAWNLGICYGDTAGHYGFWEAGLLPRRAPGADPRLPTPGTGDYERRGFLKFNERPHMLDPRQGYVFAWNSKAASWMPEGGDARIGKTFRSWLAVQLAEHSMKLTVSDMEEINRKINNAIGATDRTATSPAFFAPFLRSAAEHTDDPKIKEAVRLMLSFNGLYEDRDKNGTYDNPGLPIFREWLKVAPRVIFSASIGDWWSRVDEGRYLRYQTSLLLRALQGPAAGLPLKYDYWNGRDHDSVVVQTIRMALNDLKPKFQDRPISTWHLPIYWRYFDTSTKTPGKPAMPDEFAEGSRTAAVLGLSPAVVPHNGGDDWTGLAEVTADDPKIYTVTGEGGQDLFIDPSGRGNAHIADQVELHAESKFKTINMLPALVRATAKSVMIIEYQERGSHPR